MEAAKWFVVFGLVAFGVWGLYMLMKLSDKAKEERSNEAPYKVEPPKSTEQLAVPLPHKPIEWTFANAPEPKRKYTKRSKYWTDKRKKAAARKAKKKTRKSK